MSCSCEMGMKEFYGRKFSSLIGFIQASMSKFKEFSRTSTSLSNSFQGLKVNEKC